MEEPQVSRSIELSDGSLMPALGLGTWKPSPLPPSSVQGAVEAAIAAGYRHIDTAHSYNNEVHIGKALRSKMQQGIIRRQDMFIVSKLWLTHHAPEDIPVCLDMSLKDLQLDYLDLYLKMGDELFPKKDGKMLTSDIDYVDVWRGMEALQASGKVRSIGIELHPYLVQTEMIELCKSKNIVLTAFSPFGSPARPPELLRGETDPLRLLEDPVVADIAKKHRHSPAQVLLRFHVQQGVAVIPKSDKPHHILENTKIFDFSLTEEDMRALRGLDRGWRSCLLEEEVGGGGGLHSAHTRRGSCNTFRQVWASGPRVLVGVVHLRGSGEHHALPAVAPQHVDPSRPHGHPRLAVGQQQLSQAGLHPQDVETLRGVLVVVAAPQDVDEVFEGGHAVPAPRQSHGRPLRPHLAVPGRLIAQDLSAVRADLKVVTS
ncbi:hypothetical protein F7725_022377 [Dissostichus mawsoni]|uniref:NADP-dependent oxidoreductase domain-containing protein n=1 Tax=Dissostichus mawsoni TaxID=36200 RepID=A0A7J5YXL9_DISMA|nr:hypothetical protein F7725_022377 [Dissostichus mawsoni]